MTYKKYRKSGVRVYQIPDFESLSDDAQGIFMQCIRDIRKGKHLKKSRAFYVHGNETDVQAINSEILSVICNYHNGMKYTTVGVLCVDAHAKQVTTDTWKIRFGYAPEQVKDIEKFYYKSGDKSPRFQELMIFLVNQRCESPDEILKCEITIS